MTGEIKNLKEANITKWSIGFVIFISVALSQMTVAREVLLATTQRTPYIGQDLPENGYVFELVKAVFSEMNYKLHIEYFPLARARRFAEKGRVDGIVPEYFDRSLEDAYVFSDPFPGDNIGILKRTDADFIGSSDVYLQTPATLKNYKVGLIRDNVINHALRDWPYLTTEYVNRPIQNIDKLEARRIDFTLIDKYTASELIVHERPQLIGRLEFINPPLLSNRFHIAFSKKKAGYKRLLSDFNEGLSRLTDKGEVDRILSKHGLYPQPEMNPGKITLNIGTVNNNDMLIMKELSSQYEAENPHIRLNWRIMDENTLRLRLMGDLAISDGQFDIMTIGAYEAPIWAEKKWLVPLRNLPENYQTDDLLPGVREVLSYNGELYALPFYAESSMTYYRSDLFENAGLSMPALPAYQDIRRFAEILHNPDDGIYGICLRGKPGWGENIALLSTMVNTFGGRWFDLSWKPQFTSDEWRHAVTAYVDLLKNYGPPFASKNGFAENLELFASGKCAMWIDATVAAGMLFNPKNSEVYNKLGFAPAPVANTPKGSHWLWTWALAIPQSSVNQEEALKFISWATSREYIEKVSSEMGWVSVPPGTRYSTYQNEAYVSKSPFAGFVLDAIKAADPVNSTLKPSPYTGIQFVSIPEFPAIGSHVGVFVSKILDGQATVDQALFLSQKWTEDQMQRSGYYH